MSLIAILDYELGNIQSISAALRIVGSDVLLTRRREDIVKADGVVLPGVGAFSHGMNKLREHGLISVVEECADANKPILGICLGMQMLLSESYEFGLTKGLGLIPGSVRELDLAKSVGDKLPHVSWSEIEPAQPNSWTDTIFRDTQSGEDMYFVHSFRAIPENQDHILSETRFAGATFCSAVKNGNVYGCQFHPEKSGESGLKIIKSFIDICNRGKSDARA